MTTTPNAECAQADFNHPVATRPTVVPTPAQLPRRSFATNVPAPQRRTEVLATLRAADGCVAWVAVIAHPGQSPYSMAGHARGHVAAGTKQLAAQLRELAAEMPIALFTTHACVANAIADVPNIEVYPKTIPTPNRLASPGIRELAAELRAATVDAPRLTVAVDGSWSRCKRTAGWAVLGANGRYFRGSMTHATSPDAAEVRAIRQALSVFRSPQRLRILSDSRHAIAFVRDPSTAPAALRREATEIAESLRHRDVQIVWTKGHTGAGLHDGADRLAVQARRAEDGNLGLAVTRPVAERIVAESIAAHADSGTAEAHGLAA